MSLTSTLHTLKRGHKLGTAHALGRLPLAKEFCRALGRVGGRARDIGGERERGHNERGRSVEDGARGLERDASFVEEEADVGSPEQYQSLLPVADTVQ